MPPVPATRRSSNRPPTARFSSMIEDYRDTGRFVETRARCTLRGRRMLEASHRPDRTALVLARGAARGAYEVGVVQHIVEEVARDLGRPIRFDVLCGTSVGALNACGLAAYAELGAASIHRVIEVWTSLQVSELVRPDVRGILQMGARLLG